jgi:hypothetical protein
MVEARILVSTINLRIAQFPRRRPPGRQRTQTQSPVLFRRLRSPLLVSVTGPTMVILRSNYKKVTLVQRAIKKGRLGADSLSRIG